VPLRALETLRAILRRRLLLHEISTFFEDGEDSLPEAEVRRLDMLGEMLGAAIARRSGAS
jgi:hypothetical protein